MDEETTKKEQFKNENNDDSEIVMDENAEVSIEENSEGCQEKLQKVKGDLKACLTEKNEYLMGWQRSRADFINSKKTHEKELAEIESLVGEKFIGKLLPVIDSFEMAMTDKKKWESVDKDWRLGVEGIFAKLMTILRQSGLEEVGKIGEKLDVNIHQAVKNVSLLDKDKDNTVTEVLQKGYMMSGKIIRPAKVSVGEYSEEDQRNKSNS